MSGEIERTLEISNQSIINAAIDMSSTNQLTTQQLTNSNNNNLAVEGLAASLHARLLAPPQTHKEHQSTIVSVHHVKEETSRDLLQYGKKITLNISPFG